MDDPGLDRGRHVEALDALDRINRVSLGALRIWREVRRIHARTGRPVRVLDVACGGGDVLHAVARRAWRHRLPLVAHGCDVSPVAIDEFRRRAAGLAGGQVAVVGAQVAAEVDVFSLDVLEGAFPDGYDLITSSLFLHHLDREQAVSLLRRMAASAQHSLLVQDLRRTRLGYVFAWVGLHTLTRSDVARTDGLLSVRGAFTTEEARAMCRAAELPDAAVSHGWPQRFVIHWVRA